jgi:hypothetical protein
MRDPPAIPRNDLHMPLGDTTWSPVSNELTVTFSRAMVEEMGVETNFLLFLLTLRKDLSWRFIMEVGKTSIGMGISMSSGVRAVCLVVLEPVLRGISFLVCRVLFLAHGGSGGGWCGMLVSLVIFEGEGL